VLADRRPLVEFYSGVASVALLAGDCVLAGGLEFGSVANFVKHVIVVHGGIDAEVAPGVGVE
jgi:hypothetical protein